MFAFGFVAYSRGVVPPAMSASQSNALVHLRPKRLGNDPGLDSLYPYYAGFSQRFVQGLLSAHPLDASTVVLDPWNGSGTTTAAAQRMGLRAVGLDLNPFATIVARAKLATKRGAAQVVDRARAAGAAALQADRPCESAEPLLAWMPPAAASFGRTVMRDIVGDGDTTPAEALLIVAFARACRRFAPKRSSNPTWVRPVRIPRLQRRTLLRSWLDEVSVVARLLAREPASDAGRPTTVITADARSMPLETESVNFIISSPPYCTRIDYAIKTRLELDILGEFTNRSFPDFRRDMMGTTSLRHESVDIERFPPRLRTMLASIGAHDSHRAAEYYLPGFVQYFSDAEAATSEIARVLSSGGVAFLVLQNSYFKPIHIDLPEIYLELAANHGLRGQVVSSVVIEAHRNKATVNPGARRYQANRSYYEALIKLEKRDAGQ